MSRDGGLNHQAIRILGQAALFDFIWIELEMQ